MDKKRIIENFCDINGDLNFLNYSSMVHSKKVVKHALRQQVKRRRKNTTFAAGNHRTLPKIIHNLPISSDHTSTSTDISLAVINDQQNHIGN